MVLLRKIDYNTKITEIEGKIPDVSGLATKTALTTVENKIPSVSSLVKEQTNDKYIDTPEFNKLAVDVFNARLAQANLITKTELSGKLSGLNK